MKDENNRKCGMETALKIIGNRWNLIIISSLKEKTLRYTELQKSMGDVNSKTITKHLRILEECNIISRSVYPEVPPRVEYSLTRYGRAFLPIFEEIHEWGDSIPSNIQPGPDRATPETVP
jgi:DNA-binding HxlR family transcriptional regulator